jgi:death on curing protein
MNYLSIDDVIAIHNAVVRHFSGQNDPILLVGVQNQGLLESAIHRPTDGMGGNDFHTTLPRKAAAFFHSLVKNHSFHDGNKRTALVSLAVFLERNSKHIHADDDELFDFVKDVAKGDLNHVSESENYDEFFQEIVTWIRNHLVDREFVTSVTLLNDFLDYCAKMGILVKESGDNRSWDIMNEKRRISINKRTRRLDGMVVRTYLTQLGIAESVSGINLQFDSEMNLENTAIRELSVVLTRLSKYDKEI